MKLFYILFVNIVILDVCLSKTVVAKENALYDLEYAEEYFRSFIETHNKQYTGYEEYLKRFKIFQSHLKKINELNKADDSKEINYGITPYADMSWEEFSSTHFGFGGGKKCDEDESIKSWSFAEAFPELKNMSVPDKFDWRDHDILNPARQQGQCGSCWAFSAIAALESRYAKNKNKKVLLSEEEVVDCSKGDEACVGGFPHCGFIDLQKLGGVESREDYPYTAGDFGIGSDCKFDKSKSVLTVSDPKKLVNLTDEDLKKLVVYFGALSIAMEGYTALQFFVGKDIVVPSQTECPKEPELTHAVNIVGFGEEKGKKYWIIRNSWGQDFGDQGYFRLIRGRCGVGTYAATVEVA